MASPDPFADITPFVYVAEGRSFREAARRLRVSPSAVSKAVSRLERRLGTTLVRRTSRSVSLTAEGADFFARCREIVARMDEAERAVTMALAGPRGPLRVSTPAALGRVVLTPRIPEFLARYPEVTLDLSFSDRPVDLVEENVDVAVRIGELRDSTLVARRIRGTRYLTTASPVYLARAGKPRNPGDLAAHDCLKFRMPNGTVRDWTFRSGESTETVRFPARAVFDYGEALVDAARAGGGIVQTQDYQVTNALRGGELVELFAPLAPPGPPVHTVYAPSRHLSAKVRAFVDFVAEAFAAFDATVPEKRAAKKRR